MQCSSCHFENLPGSGNCARCGASLLLATATINVHPPRAGRWSRAFPQWWTARRLYCRAQEASLAALSTIADGPQAVHFDRRTLWQSLIPGWAQIGHGKIALGRWLLGSYAVVMLLGVTAFGTNLGSILLGAAFALHLSSTVAALVSRFASLRDRIGTTVLVGLVLFGGLYLPVGWAVTRVATPLRIVAHTALFEGGEVVWYNRSAAPSCGDIAVYDARTTRFRGRTAAGRAAIFAFPRRRVDRVVARGGQTVAWREGQLLINGKVSPWRPQKGLVPSSDIKFQVPEGCLFIPTSFRLGDQVRQVAASQWQQATVVPAESVAGTVFLRSWPPWRLALIR